MPEGHDEGLVLHDSDEAHLAKLGYKQELARTWSGFSNFAISFSIISILAGCLTTFATGWNNGGPAAIAWGWPVLSLLILVIGMCMSELVSAFPTSGGIYWWASKLGSPAHGFYAGWLNLIGLLAIDASVAYGCATFFDATLGYLDSGYTAGNLDRIFLYFIIVLALAAAINIFSSHLLAVLNNISVWWHVIGAAAIIVILFFFLKDGAHHASLHDVFGTTVNNTGLFGGGKGVGVFVYLLPLSALLTQYTITGYDASVHLSEETHGAADTAAKGIWQSILYSAIGGWILLLAVLFAVQSVDGVSAGGGSFFAVIGAALTSKVAALVVFISTAGQFFCTCACMTSTSRMFFAFSRDGAVPGAKLWSKLNAHKVPVYGVIASAVVALVLTLPALVKVNEGTADAPIYVPVAFFAVVSIGVIGLYLSFAIPIYLRWKHAEAFELGSWNNGRRYRWMNPLAVIEIVIMSVVGMLPTYILGVPGADGFSMKFVNYAIIVVPVALIALTIYWHVSVKHWFKGPIRTIDLPEEPVASGV
ncbi:amino acid permease [Nocardioides ultimimeridianus]